jgi:hypothetical protein
MTNVKIVNKAEEIVITLNGPNLSARIPGMILPIKEPALSMATR